MTSRIFQWLCNQPPELFLQGKLEFTSRLPGGLRLLLFAAAAAAVWLLYRRAAGRLPQATRRWLLGLRLALLAVLFFLLGAPVLRVKKPQKEGSFTALLLDNSASMTIEDVAAADRTLSRLDAARQAAFGTAPGEPALVRALGEGGQVVTYRFADAPSRLQRPQQLDGRGPATNLFRAIHDVDAELQAAPLAAVVMLTDGCRNAGGTTADAAALLQARGVPLFILGLGNSTPPADREVVQLLAPSRVRRNSAVELDVTLRHTGFPKPFELQLKRGDTLVLARTVEPRPGSDITRLRIPFTPDHEGTATYRLEIPPGDGEKYTQNNAREFALAIRDDRLPVLYIEGSPRTEYRYLRRALFRDPDFRLVGVLRLAPNRFFIQGANAGEEFLKDGFPTTAEQLFRFQAVILGDIEADVFTPAQLALLEQFVKSRGGGLLMLGGVNSFGLGHYAGTPVGRMLPVAISPQDPPYSDEEFPATPEAAQLTHPVMKLASDPLENASIWNAAPPLLGITPVAGLKPGASLLLKNPRGGRPVLAVQDYGGGRVAAFTSGGSWFWRMSLPASDEFHEKFWKQLVRWLVVGVKEQLTVDTDAEIYARRDPVTVRAVVLGKDLTPVNDARVRAVVSDPLGNTQELVMDWILTEEGVYQCRYIPELEGAYKLAVRVEGWENAPLEKGFLVNPPVAEFADAGLKKETLQQMAAATHGKYFDFQELPSLIQAVKGQVRQAATQRAIPQDYPLWDMPLLFLAALALMGAEWFARRRAGLA
jgi:uncharacterized membrane protein